MRVLVRSFASVLLAAACAAPAAAPITLVFSGQVTSDPYGLSSFGAPIAGTVTFDPDAVDAVPAGDIGSYASIGPAFGFSVNVDGTAYGVSGAVTVNVANDIGVDQYGVIAQDAGLTLELFLEDATQAALGSDALPAGAPPLAAFGWREFRLFSADAEFLGSIDAITCREGCAPGNPVSSPGILSLSLAALGALAGLRRRRPGPRT